MHSSGQETAPGTVHTCGVIPVPICAFPVTWEVFKSKQASPGQDKGMSQVPSF